MINPLNIIFTLILFSAMELRAQDAVYNSGNIRIHGGNLAIYGDVTNHGNFSNNLGTTYLYGTSLQTIDGTSLIQANNLEVDNGSGVQLDLELQVSNQLTFTDGVLFSDIADANTEFVHFLDGASYVGASDTRHIDGVVRKTGTDAFSFPVGDNGEIQRIGISSPSSATDHYTAYYQHTDPDLLYETDNVSGCVNHVSNCEYWMLDRTSGTSTVQLTLDFDNSSCGVTHLCELLVSRWNGTNWTSEGNGGTTGSTSSGTVTTGDGCNNCGNPGAIDQFSPFTLGSATINNPLPVELLNFETIAEDQSKVRLEWTTETEINNDYFTVERSTNSMDWEYVTQVNGAGNSTDNIEYLAYDYQPYYGISYYRLKQTDYNGEFEYSNIEAIEINQKGKILHLYPNPTSSLVTIRTSSTYALSNIELYNSIGQNILNSSVYNISISQVADKTVQIDLSQLSKGVYTIKLGNETRHIIKS